MSCTNVVTTRPVVLGSPLITRIPLEIWDYIVDLSCQTPVIGLPDIGTVEICKLVCRAWHTRAFRWLHPLGRIHDKDSLAVLVDMTRNWKKLGLRPKGYHINVVPKDLEEIQGPGTGTMNHKYSPTSTNSSPLDRAWISSLPIRLFSFMRSQPEDSRMVLNFVNVDFRTTHPQFIPALSLAKSIRSLYLSQVQFLDVRHFSRLLSSFDSLLHLHINSLTICIFHAPALGWNSTMVPRGVQLNSLYIRDIPSQGPWNLVEVVKGIETTSSHQSLRSVCLEIPEIDLEHTYFLAAFIGRCNELQRLSLTFLSSSLQFSIQPFDLQNNGQLQSISFNMSPDPPISPQAPKTATNEFLTLIASTLSSLPTTDTPSLRSISIYFNTSYSILVSINWDVLWDALNLDKPIFSNLTEIQISIFQPIAMATADDLNGDQDMLFETFREESLRRLRRFSCDENFGKDYLNHRNKEHDLSSFFPGEFQAEVELGDEVKYNRSWFVRIFRKEPQISILVQ
ncbi:hypothetical protein C8Q75DRAFT_619849 [Abortiporus biennis]|nr:hypothetical protein C8Q75DRAFT_619849 [Abortiporus biennis]